MRRKKKRAAPVDPERERWLALIDRATLLHSLSVIQAHLSRTLKIPRPSILPETEEKKRDP